MAKAIKTPKQPKEPVRVRYKTLSDGSQSVYLDIYRDGKRQYEFLKLYLIPETNAAAKAQNKATLAAVNTIKSQRIIELTNGVAGLKNTSLRSKMLLLDWMQAYKESQEKKGVRGSGKLISNTMNVLRAFNAKAAMRDLNRDFCLAFIDFLRNIYVSPNGKKLSQFTCVSYFGCFRGALNTAVREEIIAENPVNRLNTDEKIKMPESKREFLTIDEVKILIDTPCRREDVKGAFLFSCYCGLRISDVLALKWKNVDSSAEQWRINIIMQKTRQPLYLPLSMNNQACNLSCQPPHLRHNVADTRCGPLYRMQAARPFGCEDHPDIRQNHQQEKGRCHQPYRHGVCQYLNEYNNIEYEKIAR